MTFSFNNKSQKEKRLINKEMNKTKVNKKANLTKTYKSTMRMKWMKNKTSKMTNDYFWICYINNIIFLFTIKNQNQSNKFKKQIKILFKFKLK